MDDRIFYESNAGLAIAAIAVAALAGVVAVLALAAWQSNRRRQRRREYVRRAAAGESELSRERRSRGQTRSRSFMTPLLRAFGLYRPIERALSGADLRLSPERFTLRVLLLMATSWLLLWLMLRNPVSAAILTLLLGPVLAIMYLRVRGARTRRQFEEELPEFLMLLSSSLRTGLSFTQALESLSAEGTGEVERQVRRAVAEISMGATPDEALKRVAERMDSQDMGWAVIAIGIQREVGGNLSNILDSVADTVRARETVRQEVRSMSAEGRLSAIVLGLLPIILLAVFAVIRPTYVSTLWTTPIGLVLLAGSGVLMIIGAIWMAALVRVKA